jgi:uncharacterized protein YndB with AHSA1/START domain
MNGAVREQRYYQAPPGVVFEALSKPEHIARWLSPADDIRTDVLGFDCRAGGYFRLGFATGAHHYGYVSGHYREVTPPRRLVFTWMWEPPDEHAGIETIVEIDLVESGGGTDLQLIHRQFPSEEMRRRHGVGWQGALARLESFLRTEVEN